MLSQLSYTPTTLYSGAVAAREQAAHGSDVSGRQGGQFLIDTRSTGETRSIGA
jgi:hypothetical protein